MSSSLVRSRSKAFQRQSGRCIYCNLPMWSDNPEQFAQEYGITIRQARFLRCTGEHLRARQDGGTTAQSNIAAACLYCNQGRHRRNCPPSPEVHMQRIRQRIARGLWHASWVFKSGLVMK
jgi:hypothetical protein